MLVLPKPHAAFEIKKAKILSQLAKPDAEYTDASPKGSVDEGIRDLIDEINTRDGLVTTSSCAGRVSVFVEGTKTSKNTGAEAEDDKPKPASAVGGKGGGGAWLYVSHDPVTEDALGLAGGEASLFGLDGSVEGMGAEAEVERLIHFKFEPMVSNLSTSYLSPYCISLDPTHPNSVTTTRTTRPEMRSSSRLPRKRRS